MQDIILSVDQGQSDGVCAAMDLDGAARIARTLAESGLKDRYFVSVRLNLSMRWWGVVGYVLDQFVNAGVYIVADAITSDTLAGADRGTWQNPIDRWHGVPAEDDHYQWLVDHYGSLFRGLWFHEVLTSHGAQQGYFPAGPGWWKPVWGRVPPDGFYRRERARPFVDFCRRNGRPLFWNEPVTSAMGNPGMTGIEAEVRYFSDAYPATVVPVWANNVGGVHTTPNWYRYLLPLVTNNSRGCGPSLQTWGNPGGKATGQEGALARQALDAGAVAVAFEALNGWIKWPDANWTDERAADALHGPAWADRGSPLPTFHSLCAQLL